MSKEAQKRYDAKNAVYFSLKLVKSTDSEIIAKLQAQSSKQGYIKRLIAEDIIKEKKSNLFYKNP